MKIAVCMKLVPDLQQIRIKERMPVLEGVPFKFSDLDLNALEAAVQLKEAQGGEVVVFCLGPPKLKDAVKEALARGGDRAVLMTDPAFKKAGSEAVSAALAAAVRKAGGIDLVLCGEGSTDHYSSQIPGRLAVRLGFGFSSWVRKLEGKGATLLVHRDMEEAVEIAEVALPAVVAVTAQANQPRLASMVQILRAAKKPVEVLAPKDLGLAAADIEEGKVAVKSDLAPVQDRKRVRIEGTVEEMAAGLKKALQREGLV